MLVQITLEIFFQNEPSAAPGVLIIPLTPILPFLFFFFFFFFFEGAEAAERAVSDSFRELLAQFNITSFRAASLGLGFVRRNRKLCYQNQFCTAFFSHTHQINNRTQKRMARCFLAR